MRPRWWLAGVAVVAGVFTLTVSVSSILSFAYRSPALHVAVETTAALVSLLAAQLVYGRFRRSLDRRDLLLSCALGLFAATNLLFSAVPAGANLGESAFSTWAAAFTGIFAVAAFAAAAYVAPRAVRRPALATRQAAALCALLLAVIALVTALVADRLPEPIAPDLSPDAGTRPRIIGDPTILGLQLVGMTLLAAAALGFGRTAERTRDPLMLWFAIAATLGAFARLNYFLFPSRYSEYFYTGDILRLGFFVALFVGGAYEIRVAQRVLERAAVLHERRRIAREIHDGLAQDLAFIVQQAEALGARDGGSRAMADIATAARRALGESRAAIAALVRPTDEPLDQAIARVANEAAGRWGASVESHSLKGLELAAPAREALLRIVGEAVTNAARHANAQRICVELLEGPELRVLITDDGIGFDAARAEQQDGHHGIAGMRDRAEQFGGQLRVESQPGDGTRVVVVLP